MARETTKMLQAQAELDCARERFLDAEGGGAPSFQLFHLRAEVNRARRICEETARYGSPVFNL
jgi:hypothetical protein